jgi:hypothetical protein
MWKQISLKELLVGLDLNFDEVGKSKNLFFFSKAHPLRWSL